MYFFCVIRLTLITSARLLNNLASNQPYKRALDQGYFLGGKSGELGLMLRRRPRVLCLEGLDTNS